MSYYTPGERAARDHHHRGAFGELFARACALIHLNTIPERFGLVLAEANAAGVPVIAMDLGSCREVIEQGVTGFLVNNVGEAVRALEALPSIQDSACRSR